MRSYGRIRNRKLRPNTQKLFDELLPELVIDQSAVCSGQWAEESTLLTANRQLQTANCLEIGFGAGEHLAMQARAHPNAQFIGCEPFMNGVGHLLQEIDAHNLKNIRIWPNDARELIAALPDACLDAAYILFPDPWPKSRHHKRRLIQPEFIESLARILKPGSTLLLATDHTDYLTWMLQYMLTSEQFSWAAKEMKDWAEPPALWVQTRYQQKAAMEGRCANFLRFERAVVPPPPRGEEDFTNSAAYTPAASKTP